MRSAAKVPAVSTAHKPIAAFIFIIVKILCHAAAWSKIMPILSRGGLPTPQLRFYDEFAAC